MRFFKFYIIWHSQKRRVLSWHSTVSSAEEALKEHMNTNRRYDMSIKSVSAERSNKGIAQMLNKIIGLGKSK